MTPMETYTHTELDQFGGALLYIGSLHASLGLLLDATRFKRDIALIEYLNYGPVGMVDELLPATAAVIDAAQGRLAELALAVDSALNSKAERVEAESVDAETRQAFEDMMNKVWGDQAQQDGLS